MIVKKPVDYISMWDVSPRDRFLEVTDLLCMSHRIRGLGVSPMRNIPLQNGILSLPDYGCAY
ncbi:MAG: hypothetical protein JSW66_16735 [Phycisphaerales bacterium]|nr:MAG: hypothetical protein JSW66_16735 [Phycisphaerales bacterium]